MQVTNLKEALGFYFFVKSFRDDVPDGQSEEVKETGKEPVEAHGKKPSLWPKDTKQEFTDEMQRIATAY